jgi:hypothetical protein
MKCLKATLHAEGKWMPFVSVPYPDGSEWLMSQCDVVIPAAMAEHLTALEIGERVLELMTHIPRLASNVEVWDMHPDLRTLPQIEKHLDTLEAIQKVTRHKAQVVPCSPRSTKGFVYIIRGESYYKIGRTNDPYKRLTPMVAHAPFPLETLLLIPTEDMFHTEKPYT